ncbi:PREDICTED: dyslexia-associated protein KIAA0319-like protein homolog [Condylura cristata]|uniref:dyslexia-associated protein KIAA0319-like protein homolog n=1 Tax=Condylura cristata TaxID=143302 RepID=UPI0003342F5B|nr:PREDICTED: dyslexia-associated protein KIAA0319-like protein homolog [Condylura cristata]XP_012577706.1 PREDICTED: dyslexia-associated protein KIAA0319-like protein homolog [Condylura cristata]XP_012577707.1 PREDICTED: dyslexia-associated protein KIAA0319-like protein homolog [Condylura cristata]XP_012577709.1 PREDICTED: dyslexia-associated protein KIAA0319-like protein homolog [Condylura cristata]
MLFVWKAMEKRLGVKPSAASWILSEFCWQTSVTWLRSLYLLYICFCFSVLWLSTDASESRCQQAKTQLGFGLRSGGENHLQLLEGTPSLQSCWAVCCQDSACHAFWWLEGMCIHADCSIPQSCRTFKTDSSNSILVFFKKVQPSDNLDIPPEDEVPHILGLGWTRAPWKRLSPPRAPPKPAIHLDNQQNLIRKLQKRESPSEVVTPVLTQHSEMNDSKELSDRNTNDSAEVHKTVTVLNPLNTTLPVEIPDWSKNVSAQPGTSEDPGTTPSTQQVKSPIATSQPVAPSYSFATSSSQASFQSTSAPSPVIKKLVVSAGESVQITLPQNEVKLNAYVLQEPLEGEIYTYNWQLITHPKDYSGEMEGKYSQTLKLSKLTPGLYEFKVIVDGQNSHGEGYVNVTVKPEPRKNRPPVAIVSPQFQEISLPTTSTVIDGSQSTDDDKIVQYHWEELKGPLREEKISGDTAILKLSKLVPGNYTFSLTVVDSDGATNSTTANLTVNKAVDYPPVANAGPNQVITLPQNSITLFGNQSTDDHGIYSYEWSLSPSSKGKVVEMQGVRTPTLQLSAMQEGDYTYQLTVTDTIGQQATAQVTVIVQPENNKPPEADAGPDKELTLPVDSTTLDGSKSSDDQKIISYLWEKTQGPDGVQLENANSSVATVTGLQVGTYVFTLTVRDERNLQSQSSVNVIVKEEMNKPPIAKITGNVVITLPTDTAELDGSKSSDDKGIVSYLWTRDEGSPAAGEVLNHTDHHPILFLSNLVEGTYTFHLKVTDAKGESDVDRTTVEVKPDPRKNNLVEIILDVNVSQLTERLKGMFIRQIGVLLGVLDSDIIVQKIQPYTEQSTKMVFLVQNEPPHQIFKGHEVAAMLKNELRKQKADFLIFRALEINTVTCQLNCSDHGHCDSFTKRCVCDPFWMENFIKVQLRDGDSNCEWSVLYVIIASFVIVVALGILSWTAVCCCKRQKGKPKRKSKYKILDATDQESLELKPTLRAGIKQKGPVLSSSLMHSESELDSDDAIFTWPDREKGRLLHGQNGSMPNGQTPLKARSSREEIL